MLMLPSWPDGPVTVILTWLLVFAGIVSWVSGNRRDLWPIPLILAINWVAARYATDLQAPGVAALGNIISGGLLILWGRALAAAIATIYVWRMVLVGIQDAGLITQVLMWDFSLALLFVQIMLLIGGSAHGHFNFKLPDPHRRWNTESFDLATLWRRHFRPY